MAPTQPASIRTKIEAELAQKIAELEKWEGELAEVQLIVQQLRAAVATLESYLVASSHEQQHSPLTTSELCRIIYDTESNDEFERARNSLSAELRSGAKGDAPRWRKLGRNAYASLEQ